MLVLLRILELLLTWGPLLLLLSGAAYFLWDKNRVMVLGWDPETDKIYPKKARIKDDHLRVKFPGVEDGATKIKTSLKGEWQGLLYTRPAVVINTRTGNQMGRLTLDDSPERIKEVYLQMRNTLDEEDLKMGSPPLGVLAELALPKVYAAALDGGHAAQLDQPQIPRWVLWAIIILGVLAIVFLLYGAGGG